MNILIPDSWLREFVKTEAKPKEVAPALSLCSLSVDKLGTSTDGDTIYHIEVPPNRYDCLSVIGVAREALAILPRFGHNAEPVKPLSAKISTLHTILYKDNPKHYLQLEVVLENPTLCPHFAAVIVENVKIAPSPETICSRLEKAGVRALNNVIDITNYLMLETGQPMHAFDFDKLSSRKNPADSSTRRVEVKKMILRESRGGEWLVTLDGAKRQLPSGSIVIEDGEKLIDLCGIMGGENSAIDEKTRRVILFAQIYDPRHIRKTSLALPLRTEAAQRFEKGLDPERVLPALYQGLQMLQKNAAATVASPLYNLRRQPFTPRQVELSLEKLNQYLGVPLPPKEICQILRSLGLEPSINTLEYCTKDPEANRTGRTGRTARARLSFTVPSWRAQDIAIEEDLIEEVARVYGYHRLPDTLPVGEPAAAHPEPRFASEHRLKFLLKDLGFTEVYTSSLVSKELAGDGKSLHVINPLGPETEYLKADPFPTVITLAKENLERLTNVSFFEIGNVHRPTKNKDLPKETTFLTAALTIRESQEKAFLKVKGCMERIFHEFGVTDYAFKDKTTFPYQYQMPLDSSTTFVIWPGQKITAGTILGVGGLATGVRNLWLFKINLEVLWESVPPTKTFVDLPEHPPLIEEISFYLSQKVTYAQAVETLKKASGGVLKQVELADHYTDESLRNKGQKSFTLKLTFTDPQKTLESRQLQPVREKIIEALQEELGAVVRAKPPIPQPDGFFLGGVPS